MGLAFLTKVEKGNKESTSIHFVAKQIFHLKLVLSDFLIQFCIHFCDVKKTSELFNLNKNMRFKSNCNVSIISTKIWLLVVLNLGAMDAIIESMLCLF